MTLNKSPRSRLAFPAPKPQVSLPIKVVFPAQHLGGTRKALSLPIYLSTRCAWLQPEHWCSVGGTTHSGSSSQPSNFTIKTELLSGDIVNNSYVSSCCLLLKQFQHLQSCWHTLGSGSCIIKILILTLMRRKETRMRVFLEANCEEGLSDSL